MSAGVGLPIAFMVIGFGTAAVIVAARRLRGTRPNHSRTKQTPRRVVMSRAAAFLLVGLVVSVANVNAFPHVPRRSWGAWVLIALVGWLPLVGGFFLLLRLIRKRIGATEFDRMVSTARAVRPVLPPGTAALKIAYVSLVIMIVIVSTIAFQLGMDHIVF